LAIKNDGSLWGWESNFYGQLGDGTYDPKLVFSRIGIENNWKMVDCGNESSLGIKNDGSLWAWGYNNYGQLGDGTFINKNYPVRIGIDNDWETVSGGYHYSAAIKENGILWTWGFPDKNLGYPYLTEYNIPHKVGSSMDFKIVIAGIGFTKAIKQNGTLWHWGNLSFNDGTDFNSYFSVQIGNDIEWQDFNNDSNTFHQLAIKNDNTLYAWGSNRYGQLGNGTQNDFKTPTKIFENVKSISTGIDFSIAITKKSSIYTWGYNRNGQLGNGNNLNVHLTTIISFCICSTTKSGQWNDPTVWSCGVVPTNLDDVIIVSGHEITIPDNYTGQANNIENNGNLILGQNAVLNLRGQ
jgi:alpha-tubulin suppressor-like RCC1 family protein